jgi:DNA invertase Pin-like site-specific DNA recombinase
MVVTQRFDAVFSLTSLSMSGYFIYCRKSSEAEDRQVLSIESQTRELQQIAGRLGLQVSDILTEAKSAKEPGRPVFNEMMQRLYRGEAAGIICWKLDRLARNPVDGGSIIWAIKQYGIRVATPAQSYSHGDDNTILMYMEFGIAQKYVDDLSRNVKRGLKTKIENGWYPGVAPVGYLNSTDKITGQRTLIKDPERFRLVRRMWDLMLTGLEGPTRIRARANQDWGFRTRPTRRMGGKPLSKSGIYHLFTNPFYYGWFESPRGSGTWHKGKHVPMVTKTEFDRVQALLGRSGIPRPSVHEFPFTGLIRCGECDSTVTAEEKHQLLCGNCRFKFAYRRKNACPRCHTPIEKMVNPKFLQYTYYHCTKTNNLLCSQKSVNGEELERQIDQQLSRIQISTRFRDWAIKYLRELHAEESKTRDDNIQARHAAYKGCLQRIDNLVKLKTAPQNADGGLLSDEEYARQRTELVNEKTRLEELFQDTGHGVNRWLELSEKTFEFACAARDRFAKGDPGTKKAILASVGSNLTLKGKTLLIQANKPFLILETSLSPQEEGKAQIEPENTIEPQRQKEADASPCPSVLGDLNEARTLYHKNELVVQDVYYFFRSMPPCPCEDCGRDFFLRGPKPMQGGRWKKDPTICLASKYIYN